MASFAELDKAMELYGDSNIIVLGERKDKFDELPKEGKRQLIDKCKTVVKIYSQLREEGNSVCDIGLGVGFSNGIGIIREIKCFSTYANLLI